MWSCLLNSKAWLRSYDFVSVLDPNSKVIKLWATRKREIMTLDEFTGFTLQLWLK